MNEAAGHKHACDGSIRLNLAFSQCMFNSDKSYNLSIKSHIISYMTTDLRDLLFHSSKIFETKTSETSEM